MKSPIGFSVFTVDGAGEKHRTRAAALQEFNRTAGALGIAECHRAFDVESFLELEDDDRDGGGWTR